MAEMSSMSESEIQAVIEEQASNKKEFVNSRISAAVLKVRWHADAVADAI